MKQLCPLSFFVTIALSITILLLSGCVSPKIDDPRTFLKKYQMADIQRERFRLCYQYGCTNQLKTGLDDKRWQQIVALFSPPPQTASEERVVMARAIQALERITGELTGVDQDIGGTFPGVFRKGQMDCEDEAVNTAVFLLFLQEGGQLRFHRFCGIAQRGFIPNGWPHMASAIEEIESGRRFVVDSWFLDHGMPVHILPEPIWMDGWKPDKNHPARVPEP